MKRYLEKYLLEDLPQKIVLLTGARQVGKTTLSKMLRSSYDYLNFDNPEDRIDLLNHTWDRKKSLVIFDELHKMKNWKSWLKGIYDKEGVAPSLIVTGSARLDTYRKVGDSLAGRFFQFRLHPLDLKEINNEFKPKDLQAEMEKLFMVGGFPEPYLKGTKRYYNRWKRSHLDIILRQDLIELEDIRQLTSVETLIQLLRSRVGSPVSYSSLARDLQCSDKTVKRWLTVLENMYVVFKVMPYHRNIARSILKAPKYYFYDTGQVMGDEGIKLENLVACALYKEIHFKADCLGEENQLFYVRDKSGREIDFCVVREDTPKLLIEVKWRDKTITNSFKTFQKSFDNTKMLQLVGKLDRERTYPDGKEVRAAHKWLSACELQNSIPAKNLQKCLG